METEHVFKALADHHRRYLLDVLAQRDGQTLTELCTHLPMTRFGVMKHLQILEEAGLIRTRKVGREKRHYLNPAPIQDVAAWVEPYRRFWEERLDRLDELLQDLQRAEPGNGPGNNHSES
jgi:predicted transcriptional regulator